MTLPVGEFMRRFLLHVLPRGFIVSATTACWRMRHACRTWRAARPPPPAVLAIPELAASPPPAILDTPQGRPCPCCGGPMRVIETFLRGHAPRTPMSPRGASP